MLAQNLSAIARQLTSFHALCPAPRFFDRTGCGYFKTEDLRRLLHSLGLGLPQRLVKELVADPPGVSGASVRFKGGCGSYAV